MYHRFSIRFKTCGISNIYQLWETPKMLWYHVVNWSFQLTFQLCQIKYKPGQISIFEINSFNLPGNNFFWVAKREWRYFWRYLFSYGFITLLFNRYYIPQLNGRRLHHLYRANSDSYIEFAFLFGIPQVSPLIFNILNLH